MARQFVGGIVNGRFLIGNDYFAARDIERARSSLPAPTVIGDSIELKSMVDGKVYTSKAALRASYRAKGYVEVGNERLDPPAKPKPNRKAIRDSAARALSQVGISVS